MFLSDLRKLARFRATLRKLVRASELAARSEGLTPQQHQLLVCIAGMDTGAGVPIRQIADALQLRHHSTVELIDRAEQEGYVARHNQPEDARTVLIQVTPAGMRKLRRLAAHHRRELNFLRAHVTLAPGQDPYGRTLRSRSAPASDDEE